MVHQATRVVQQALLKQDVKCDILEKDEHSMVVAGFNMKSGNSVRIHFISMDEDNDVAIRVFGFIHVEEEQRAAALKGINTVNDQFRFAKFTLEEDGDVNVEMDIPQKVENLGPVAFELMIRIVQIMEEAYPILMRAIWA